MRRLQKLLLACSVIGAIALVACAAPAIACDDYTSDQAVPEAALRDLGYTQTGAPEILLATRGPVRRFFAPPQRFVVEQQRPQRFVIEQQRPQRIIFEQAPRRRFIVPPPQQVIVRPQRVFRVPQPPLQINVSPY